MLTCFHSFFCFGQRVPTCPSKYKKNRAPFCVSKTLKKAVHSYVSTNLAPTLAPTPTQYILSVSPLIKEPAGWFAFRSALWEFVCATVSVLAETALIMGEATGIARSVGKSVPVHGCWVTVSVQNRVRVNDGRFFGYSGKGRRTRELKLNSLHAVRVVVMWWLFFRWCVCEFVYTFIVNNVTIYFSHVLYITVNVNSEILSFSLGRRCQEEICTLSVDLVLILFSM